jgi:hypothetical protein
MADSKEIAVKASIDIGDNITKLIEKLASQIGTTTDKVFPWYVKQQVIEGWCWIGCSGFVFLAGLIVALCCIRPSLHEKDNESYVVAVVIGGILSATGLAFLLFGMGGALTQIINPEYYALKSMTGDMARLISR